MVVKNLVLESAPLQAAQDDSLECGFGMEHAAFAVRQFHGVLGALDRTHAAAEAEGLIDNGLHSALRARHGGWPHLDRIDGAGSGAAAAPGALLLVQVRDVVRCRHRLAL